LIKAVAAGDDYEIAFTAPPEKRHAVAKAAAQSGTRVTEIGRVTTGQGAALLDESATEIPIVRAGYTHF
jgi:thiamine-monophosphate kinase